MTATVYTWPAPPPRQRGHGKPYPTRLDPDRRKRDEFIRVLRSHGWHPHEIADAYAVSVRTVYTALQGGK